MCGVARLGSASRDQATGLVVGGTHHNSSKGDTADPVVWSLFCSGLGDCCPIFALFARGRADRSALTIICCDPAGILPTLLVSRSSVFSWDSTRLFNAVTNQSIRRPTLADGHQKTTHQQLSVMLFSCTCWKGPGSVMY